VEARCKQVAALAPLPEVEVGNWDAKRAVLNTAAVVESFHTSADFDQDSFHTFVVGRLDLSRTDEGESHHTAEVE
jgi:hypothetical protein